MIKKCHYDVILWGGFGSTKCDPNLTSHLRRFFAGQLSILGRNDYVQLFLSNDKNKIFDKDDLICMGFACNVRTPFLGQNG